MQFLNTKESIILTAISIIDELGIQGLTTREVANREGMSNAVVFNHFRSKNELIIAVLEYFTQYDTAIIQTISYKKIEPKKAIIFMFEALVTYYENYPAITSIIQATDGLLSYAELSDDVKYILANRENNVKKLVEEAQKRGEIAADIESELITDIIFGTFKKICIKWRTDGYKFPLKNSVLNAIDTILEKFKNNK